MNNTVTLSLCLILFESHSVCVRARVCVRVSLLQEALIDLQEAPSRFQPCCMIMCHRNRSPHQYSDPVICELRFNVGP